MGSQANRGLQNNNKLNRGEKGRQQEEVQSCRQAVITTPVKDISNAFAENIDAGKELCE